MSIFSKLNSSSADSPKRDFSYLDAVIDQLDDDNKRDLMRLGLLRFIDLLPSALGLVPKDKESTDE